MTVSAKVPGTTAQALLTVPITVWQTTSGGRALTLMGDSWPGSSTLRYGVKFLSIPKFPVGTDHYFIDLWAEGHVNRDYFNWQAVIYAEVK